MQMKKKTLLFILILVAAIVIFLLGFGRYAGASIPFQDQEMVPVGVLEKQANDLRIGKILMMLGGVLFFGDVLVRILIRRKK